MEKEYNLEELKIEDLEKYNKEEYVRINSSFMYVMIVMNGYVNNEIGKILKAFNHYRKVFNYKKYYDIKIKDLIELLKIYPNPVCLKIYKNKEIKLLKSIS